MDEITGVVISGALIAAGSIRDADYVAKPGSSRRL